MEQPHRQRQLTDPERHQQQLMAHTHWQDSLAAAARLSEDDIERIALRVLQLLRQQHAGDPHPT